MQPVDPVTAVPLAPSDTCITIQRTLFTADPVHIYNIPPLRSTAGHDATSWTANDNARKIFTAQLKVLESAVNPPSSSAEDNSTTTTSSSTIRIDIHLLAPTPPSFPSTSSPTSTNITTTTSPTLFAACPYTTPAAIEQAINSSRFFALRVVGGVDGRQKATLGIGFEDRALAFDFRACLADAQRVLGWERGGAFGAGGQRAGNVVKGTGVKEGFRDGGGHGKKDGKIAVDFSAVKRRVRDREGGGKDYGADKVDKKLDEDEKASAALFSIKAPPGSSNSGAIPILPPPPSSGSSTTAGDRRSHGDGKSQSDNVDKDADGNVNENGFDDDFGDFV